MNAHTQRAPSQSPAAATLAGWALLTMDGVRLALPQKDIVTIGLVAALLPAQDAVNAIGCFVHNGERWLVYCLDRCFVPVPMLATTARVCVLVRVQERIFGLVGTQVVLLASNADLEVQPLPACLVQSGSPLAGLALHNDGIVLSVHASLLADYLDLKRNTTDD